MEELSESLSQGRSRSAQIGGLIAGAVCFVTFVTYMQWKFGLNQPPRTSGDEPGYDSIAWELSQGRGFQLNYSDPEFRTLYREAS
ncbi:MAG TPA: hypothetical protein VLA12_19220, partial [Planctomycetaceae bacterium]|nr:hypothetical protein [Planctomycetaceae bacterium]